MKTLINLILLFAIVLSFSSRSSFARGADDGKLRTLRLALSTNGEYTAYFGGTKAGALAGMVNTLTRINGVFEKDFGVKLVLVPNTDAVIYTAPFADPYSDETNKSNWGTEVQSNLTSVIGEANYDIGHLLAGNGGGGDAGCIGCIGVDGIKGKGYSSTINDTPEGDAFDISYVAHEMAHQLGANHTFTHVTENGTGVQMEPGSGSSIMGYVGMSIKDVQPQADAYFHAISILQVTSNLKNKTCPGVISTGNFVPVVNAGSDYTIPKGTPFMLTGSASDGNADDVLTYSWEQMNAGSATTSTPSSTATSGPIFRSYLPNLSATRYFPKMETVLAGLTTTQGTDIPVEVLPSVARTLKFALTVRDNRAGGPANNADDVVLSVDGNSGPFTVDSQNSVVAYPVGSTQNVNWSVAGTDANGVNCATVDIFLSNDGGRTWPITLLAATPNDGSANVVIPNIPGIKNRIMVKGTNQIFFDVNNADFAITASGSSDTTAPSASTLSASGTTTSGTNLTWTVATDSVGVVGYDVYQNGAFKSSVSGTALAVSGLSASTSYSFYVKAKDAAGNRSVASNTISVTTLAPAPSPTPSLTPSPTPTLTPSSVLSVSLTVPAAVARRATATFAATASSTGGSISRVEFYVAGALVCTDSTAAYTCSWKAPGSAKTVTVEARAFDSTGAQKSAFQTMQVTR